MKWRQIFCYRSNWFSIRLNNNLVDIRGYLYQFVRTALSLLCLIPNLCWSLLYQTVLHYRGHIVLAADAPGSSGAVNFSHLKLRDSVLLRLAGVVFQPGLTLQMKGSCGEASEKVRYVRRIMMDPVHSSPDCLEIGFRNIFPNPACKLVAR